MLDIKVAQRELAENGIVKIPGFVDSHQLKALEHALDAVFDGNYASGEKPIARNREYFDRCGLHHIRYPNVSDPNIANICDDIGIGELTGGLCDSNWTQAWFIHAVYKFHEPGQEAGNFVGWHQDGQYTDTVFDGDFVTANIHLTEGSKQNGSLRYLQGSHTMPVVEGLGSGFSHSGSLESLTKRVTKNLGREFAQRLEEAEAGDVTFHSSRLIHGSGPCDAGEYRKVLVLHMRTEKNNLKDGGSQVLARYGVDIANEAMCPTFRTRAC